MDPVGTSPNWHQVGLVFVVHHHPPITEGDAGWVFCVIMSVSNDANGAGMAGDAFDMPPLLKRDDDAVNACG